MDPITSLVAFAIFVAVIVAWVDPDGSIATIGI